MARKTRQKAAPPRPPAPAPLDVVDGIPDRSAHPQLWKYILLAAIFVGWVVFMVVSALAGGP